MGHPNAKATPMQKNSNISTIIIQPIYHNNNMSDSYAIKEARVQETLANIAPEIKSNFTYLTAKFNILYY